MKRKKRWVEVQSSLTAEWASVTSFLWSLCLEATARHNTCRQYKVKARSKSARDFYKDELRGCFEALCILDYERTDCGGKLD